MGKGRGRGGAKEGKKKIITNSLAKHKSRREFAIFFSPPRRPRTPRSMHALCDISRFHRGMRKRKGRTNVQGRKRLQEPWQSSCTCAYALRSSRGKYSAMAPTLGTMLPTMGTISRRRGEGTRARAHATHGETYQERKRDGDMRGGGKRVGRPEVLYTAFSPLSFVISSFPSRIVYSRA